MPDDLETLTRKVKALEDAGPSNPFEDPTVQLALESGGTISARTRRVQLTCGQFPDAAAARMRFDDGAVDTAAFGVRVPADWVEGTDLTLNLPIFTSGTGNLEFDSLITSHSDGETESLGNIESVTAQIEAVSANVIETISRTITGTSISPDEMLRWAFTRDSVSANDTVGAAVDAFYGAYVEYTAFF